VNQSLGNIGATHANTDFLLHFADSHPIRRIILNISFVESSSLTSCKQGSN
jgi:hypothetical protein